jgi:hypothetical protein
VPLVRDVAVNTAHAGYLVAPAVGLERVADMEIIEPRLMSVPFPEGRQAGG